MVSISFLFSSFFKYIKSVRCLLHFFTKCNCLIFVEFEAFVSLFSSLSLFFHLKNLERYFLFLFHTEHNFVLCYNFLFQFLISSHWTNSVNVYFVVVIIALVHFVFFFIVQKRGFSNSEIREKLLLPNNLVL